MTSKTFQCLPGTEARVTLAWIANHPDIKANKILVGMLKHNCPGFRVWKDIEANGYGWALRCDSELITSAMTQYLGKIKEVVVKGYWEQMGRRISQAILEVDL